MRVTDSAYSTGLASQIQSLALQQTRLQSEVSSGQRITNPEDDPAAMGRVLDAENQQGQVQQYYRNAQTAININQASSSDVSSIKDLSDRAGEIAALSNGTASSDSMQAYSIEVNQLMEQALQTANGKLNDSYLFGGTKSDTAPFTATRDASGQITGVSYQGAASSAQIAVDSGTTISPSTSGSDNANLATFIDNLGKLRDALSSGDTSAVSATQTALNGSEENIVNIAGSLGAVGTRLETASSTNSARFDSLSSQISTDTSADLPSTVIKLTSAQTAYQSALETGAKIFSKSLLDYI